MLSWAFIPGLLWWRTRPVPSAAWLTVCLAGWSITWLAALPANTGYSPWLLAAPLAVYSTTRHSAQRNAGAIMYAVMLAASFLSPVMWHIDLDDFSLHYRTGTQLVFGISFHWLLLSAVFSLARYMRRQEEDRRAREAAAHREERLLIARELHDVLAHSLTLLKVQANAGLVAAREEPQAAREALENVRDTADAALGDVRSIVHALRGSEGNASSADRQPTQQLADLPELIAGFRDAGLLVAADSAPPPSPPLPALTQLAVVRIVSEALTNVVRHQGPGTEVQISINYSPQVRIDVESRTTHPSPSGAHGTGNGLTGLHERAESLGGALSVSGDAHHFRLCATLPPGALS
ncbi:sensor histidine kinase [Corynebacterium sp.]|uniref:sensor histidine kinase n=1 Tax=Corynebacterium sp. TaxID=1720 RepID=UPI0026DC7F85|nr:histidine kinase [Corynebacterium sp.]MDO5031224.1 histidine kinase [Corynebacterium sp.]